MRIQNNVGRTRPRGKQSPSNNLNPRQNHCFQLHLHLTTLLQTVFASFSCKSVGLPKKHRTPIQEDSLPFVFCPAYKKRVSDSVVSQRKGHSQLHTVLLSVLSAYVSRAFITSARELIRDRKYPKSVIVEDREDCFQGVQVDQCRFWGYKNIICSISYLAVGLLIAILLRRSGTQTQSDTYLRAADQTRGQYLRNRKCSLHALVAILIALSSSNRVLIQKEIAKCFGCIFGTGSIFDMDVPVSTTRGVYRPAKDRLEEAEASTLQDVEMEAKKEALAVNENAKKPTSETSKVAGNSSSTLPPDQEHMSLGQTRMATTNRTETNGNMGATNASSSNLNLLAGDSARAYRSNSMYRLGSFSSPDLGSMRTDTQQAGDSLPRRGLFSRVTSTFSRRNRNGIDRSQIGSPMPIINEDAIHSIEIPTNIRLVRNLELEAQARLMGFELPQNRFGLPEEISDDNVASSENGEKVSFDAETVVGLEISDDASVYTDNASTINEAESITRSYKLVQSSPPDAANVAMSESERGLNYQQRASRYSTSWLADCFTTSATDDFLKDFGAPPRVSKFPPRSSSLPKMAEGDQKIVRNIDERELGGIDSPEAVDRPSEITRATEINRLREVVRELVEKFSTALSLKDAEIKDLNARVAAALERVRVLESLLEGQKAGLEGPKELAKNGRESDHAADNHDKSGLMPTSKDSFGGSSGERSSHKKSTSKEGGFFKNLIGTTEPSQLALKKLKERSLAEANADENDPGLAARLKVSSRQLPPEAPKPASKEPVPIPKTYQRHSRSTGTLTGQFDPELTLSLNSPSRAPPARPGSPSGPERVSLDKPLPEIKPEEAEKDEGKKDGKKRGLRNLFGRK